MGTRISPSLITRRAFGSSLAGAVVAAPGIGRRRRTRAQEGAPAILNPERARPAITYGVARGDVAGRSAVVLVRGDLPARMPVEWAAADHRRRGAGRGPPRVRADRQRAAADRTPRLR
jgi:phosphodiesterase/alkaline phosphatase D-like protein